MKVYFRTEASVASGTGHLMRCLALAQTFNEQTIECLFIVRQESLPFCRARHDWQFSVIAIPDSVLLHQEIHYLAEILHLEHSDYLVLDSYKFDTHYLRQAKQLKLQVILFDDLNDRGELPVDLIINGAGNADSLGYAETAPTASLCLGSEYRILRTEFLSEVPQPLSERKSLTIVMGGTDSRGLLLQLLQNCEDQAINTPVRAVLTRNHCQLELIQAFVEQTNLTVQLVLDCQDLASIFAHSLLTISAAGSTQFELLAMQSPAILLIIADNQENATRDSEQQGWCQVVDMRDSDDTGVAVNMAKNLLAHPDKLQSMLRLASKQRNVGGANRILDTMAELGHD